ncbi:MAG: 3'-5' exonuclease [Gammaproteobacteria bacterium]|nr:3'-5' exonuclease [Gammaproteobacteria bacterium]
MRQGWLSARRWWSGRQAFEPPFAGLVKTDIPPASAPVEAVEFVSLDIETTGLDAATADMLSVGWVVVRGNHADLESAEMYIVRPSGDVGDSASVHGLTDTVVGAGLDWGVVLDKIVRVLTGRVLVVHHAGLDKALLDRMCRERYGAPLLVPVVDTLALEHRRLRRIHHIEAGGSLKLANLREAYALPRYAAHDCLVDAIATAELLLAIIAHRPARRLGDLSA